MSGYVMPNEKAVRQLLVPLYGDELRVEKADVNGTSGDHVATYIDDGDELVAVCSCDAGFVGFAGAALTMMPADVAQEMVSATDFSDIVLGNFHEVMNICSRLLMNNESPHLRLDETLAPAAAEAALSRLGEAGGVAGFNVEIPGYGRGRFVFRVTA